MMAQCITCGTELHPERAEKYDYCMARECQEKNAKGLTMVAVGMNKAADELMILDERTQADLASGRYRDQRRGSFGTSAPAPAPRVPAAPASPTASASSTAPAAGTARASHAAAQGPQPPARRARPRPAGRPAAQAASSRPWTERQERLALLYNEQGLRPDEIADKLGVSRYLATQIVLAARNRARA
jgi:hypothetical protein